MNDLLSAADNHNVANGDASWLEGRIAATGDFATDISEGILKGIPTAVVAGINSFINSGIAVANFVGADVEAVSTYGLMKNLDDDLAQYYKQHDQGIEIAGLVAGSFLPGTAGIKAMQAAKAGFIGSNMAKSSGLMRSLTADYATAAKLELAANTAPFSVLNKNVVLGLAQGAGSQFLEAAAFETAVAATMFKSPVLDQMSATDLAKNIAVGTIIGGGIGSVIHGIRSTYGLKKFAEGVDKELFPYKNINELNDLASPELKLINYFETKLNMPEPTINPTATKIDLTNEQRLKLMTEAREKSLERLDLLIRGEFNRYADGDEVLGGLLFNKFKDVKSVDEVVSSLIHSKTATRVTENEQLVLGDVLFPKHKLTSAELEKVLESGNHLSLIHI